MVEKYKKLIYCIVLLLVFCSLAVLIKNYFKPFFFIILIIFICNPMCNFMIRHNIFKRKTSAIISLIFINMCIFFSMFLIGNYLAGKINIFINTGYKIIEGNIELISGKIGEITKINIINEGLKSSGSKEIIGNSLKKGAVYTTEGIVAYIIANISAYFVLVDKEAIFNFLAKLIYKDNLYLIKKKYNDINKLLKIELALILVCTFETILGFYALNIENALVLGIISGVLDLLPYVGIIFVFLPLILIKIFQGKYIIVGGLVCLYILLVVSRQIMEAKFMSNKLKIHPLSIMLSLYIGIKVFGIIGVFIGPIYVITAKEIIMS